MESVAENYHDYSTTQWIWVWGMFTTSKLKLTGSGARYTRRWLLECNQRHHAAAGNTTRPPHNLSPEHTSINTQPQLTAHHLLHIIRSGCRTGLECSTTTCSDHAFSFRLPPRTEDRSVPAVIPWCDLTMYSALSVRPSLSADLSPCTGCYKLISLTLYGGPAAAVR